jgi:HrpA-like RNA helicase
VLATNVAETSLTIPGIVYVVDAGVARCQPLRPAHRRHPLHVETDLAGQRRPAQGPRGRIEQRRLLPPVRRADFLTRPAYTDPEIKRVGLAGVILRMKALGLGDRGVPVPRPAAEARDRRGLRVLEELGALDDDGALTTIGKQLGALPLDPRIGRMILGGAERRCREVLVLAPRSACRIPRERPARRAAAGPTRCTAAVPRRDAPTSRATSSCGPSAGAEAEAHALQLRAVPRQLPLVSPDARVGGHPPQLASIVRELGFARTPQASTARRSTARSSPACSARSACGTPRARATSARGRRAS